MENPKQNKADQDTGVQVRLLIYLEVCVFDDA